LFYVIVIDVDLHEFSGDLVDQAADGIADKAQEVHVEQRDPDIRNDDP
jgi:hypothetical protein